MCVCELTASVCDLPDGQTGQSHGHLEGVCAAVGQRERCVLHTAPRQHQSVAEQEEAHVGHLLEDPDDQIGIIRFLVCFYNILYLSEPFSCSDITC